MDRDEVDEKRLTRSKDQKKNEIKINNNNTINQMKMKLHETQTLVALVWLQHEASTKRNK